MAKSTASAGMVPDLSKIGEVRGRLLFLLGAIVVFRIGSFIPVPGIDPRQLEQLFSSTQGSILDMFNMFSGGALHRLSIFALGVMPYISASIIVQLMAAVVPQLKDLKKRRRVWPAHADQVHPVRDLGLGDLPVDRRGDRTAVERRCDRAWLRVRFHCDGVAGHRHDVSDVAG